MKVIKYNLTLIGNTATTDKSIVDSDLVKITKEFVAKDILSMSETDLEKLIFVEIEEIEE